MATMSVRQIRQPDLQRIADAGVEMVALSRRLLELSDRVEAVDRGIAAQLREEVSRLLDLASGVSGAAEMAANFK